ncbi:MAG: hypothetical protein GX622_00685 [Bacteroidales bacterium]|nr:hypothetical protein [Bacteroidales bacterium]
MNKALPGCLVIVLLLFLSCSKEPPADTGTIVSREAFAEHLDENSEFIIILPDIQNYISVEAYTPYLEKIISCILALDTYGFKIKAVIQVGDVTNYNTPGEWERARSLFSRFDYRIPYIMCTGNHDYGVNGDCSTRETLFSGYFNYRNDSSLVASFERDRFENTVFEVELFNRPVHIYSLEFGPRDKVLTWADSVAKANTGVMGILLTHAYMFKAEQRYDFSVFHYEQNVSPYAFSFSMSEKVNDGEEIWQKLVRPNDIFRFVFSGHKTSPDYLGTLISENTEGNGCLQILFNTQDLPYGGEGWFQILEFHSDMRSASLKNYSVLLNAWENSILNKGSFIYK